MEAFLKENGSKKQEMIDIIYEQDEKLRRFEEDIASLKRKLSLREDKISRQDELVSRLSIDKKKQFVLILTYPSIYVYNSIHRIKTFSI